MTTTRNGADAARRRCSVADGERRKLRAQAGLSGRHYADVLRARRVLLRLLLDRGRASIDDVRDQLGDLGPEPARWLGSVPGELLAAGIIRRAGYVETKRAEAHARPVSEWELVDRPAALAWLAVHPEPAPAPYDGPPLGNDAVGGMQTEGMCGDATP